MSTGAEYRFVSWVRAGVGAILEGQTRAITLDLGSDGSVTRPVAQLEPGDAVGLDQRAVVRSVPANGVTDFEPNLFPCVELAHPAIPWMLCPPSAKPQPWIALVVVQVGPGITLAAGVGGRAVLTIEPPAPIELPNLDEAWAWVHAQENNVSGAPLDTAALGTSRGTARSRLICPRALKPRTAYLACVVPTFAAGAAAGLGEPPRVGQAWTGQETTVRLPVYYSWRFSTGDDGDFTSLVRRIQPEVLEKDVGHRTIDISQPHWGLPAHVGANLDVAGALYSPEWTPPATPPPPAITLGAAIASQIDTAASTPPNAAPVFAPPFYGSAASQVDSVAAAPPWQRALNTDISERIAAGIGAQVVRANLDKLVDAAWRAVGDSEAVNRLIRHAELAAAITQRLGDKHVAPLVSSGELLAVARPLLARMRILAGSTTTVVAAARATSLPLAALSASFRRLGRARGTIAARVATTTGTMVERLEAKLIAYAPAKVLAAGAASFDAISIATSTTARLATATAATVLTAAQQWKSRIGTSATTTLGGAHAAVVARALPISEVGRTPPLMSDVLPTVVQLDEFAIAARVHQRYIAEHLSRISDVPPPFDLSTIRGQIAAQWTPAAGIVPILASRIGNVDATQLATFEPVTVRPVLEQPMIGALQTLSPELVMPGVGAVLPNRMAIAAANSTFVRALLVGANEELARELLWRRYPGALGHTWLQTFWGRIERAPDGSPVSVPDIPPIETWPPDGPAPEGAQLMLLVRADVLKRYPNVLVYAVEAKWQGNFRVVGDGDPMFPLVTSTLGPDIALFGFDLSLAKARGTDTPGLPAGWYFVIAEHPHEPRFGLAASPHDPPGQWGEVAWSDLDTNDVRNGHVVLGGSLATRVISNTPLLRWGTGAAQQAVITIRKSTRVAIHSSRLV